MGSEANKATLDEKAPVLLLSDKELVAISGGTFTSVSYTQSAS